MAAEFNPDTARGDSDASRRNFPGSSGESSSKIHTKCLKRAEKSCRAGSPLFDATY